MMNLFFVGGMSGAGKTTTVESLRSRHPGIRHVVAGELIRRGLKREGSNAYVRPRVQDTNQSAFFQEVLIQEFRREIEQDQDSIILDGHFVVPTEVGPSPVPPYVFSRLGVNRLFLLLCEPKDLAIRLRQRSVQARWWDGEVNSLNQLQLLEERHARTVEREAHLPLSVSNSSDAMASTLIEALDSSD